MRHDKDQQELIAQGVSQAIVNTLGDCGIRIDPTCMTVHIFQVAPSQVNAPPEDDPFRVTEYRGERETDPRLWFHVKEGEA